MTVTVVRTANLTQLSSLLSQDSAAQTYAPLVPTTQSSFRNVIINGSMVVNQRNPGSYSRSFAGGYIYDRWRVFASSNGGALSTNIPTTDVPSGQSFTNSLKIERTSLGSQPSTTSSYYFVGQRIEGYYAAQLGYGSNNNLHTLSFWVKSSLAGIYCVSFRNKLLNRSYVAEYTVNQVDTWEKKTITLPADSSGTWEKANDIGIELNFALGSGSDNNTNSPNSWTSTSSIATSNQVNWSGTLNNTFFITGVQLEPGSVATPFEHRPYPVELDLCQRYYTRIEGNGATSIIGIGYAYSTTGANCPITAINSLRTAASSIESSGISVARTAVPGTTYNTGSTALTASVQAKGVPTITYVHGSAIFTVGEPVIFLLNAVGNLTFSAEL